MPQQPGDVRKRLGGVPHGLRLGANQFPPGARRGGLPGWQQRRQADAGGAGFCRARRRGARGFAGAAAGGLDRPAARRWPWQTRRRTHRRAQLRSPGAAAPGRRAGRGHGGARRPAVVLLHLGHHRQAQGGDLDAWPDGLRGHQPPGRPDPRHRRARRVDRRGAAVARRRHPRAVECGARRSHGAAAGRAVRPRAGLATGATAPRQQPVHRADHRQDAGRASGGGPLRPLVAALHGLRRCADVPRRPATGAAKAGPGAGAVLRPGRGDRLHHRAAGAHALGRRCRCQRPHRLLRQAAHGHGSGGARRRPEPGTQRRDRRDLLPRSGRVRRLPRQPRGHCQGAAGRLVPHRRFGRAGRPRPALHHRPRIRHVHLGRLQRLPA